MAIIGRLDKLEKFFQEKNLDGVFSYFKEAMEEGHKVQKRIFSLPVGSFEKVDLGDGVFALEQVFYTKDREDCFIESHKKYVDFQLVLDGVEEMEYIDIDKLTIDKSYDMEKDLITYELVDNTSKFVLQRGDLAVFFPDDGHIGLPKHKEKSLVYKTVIKVPVEKL